MNKSHGIFIISVLAGGLLLTLGGAAKIQSHSPSGILQAFTYRDVTLTGGPMEAQAKFARNFYLAIPDDNLLNGFRKRAGLPAPGKPMGGWYDPNNFAGGCAFGQYVSALARDYANTGDLRFKKKAARLVHGFHETIAPNGFFFISQKISTNWPCYTYDKNCAGMRDAYLLTGNKEALVVLKTMTDWAFKNLPRRKDEWYTLPENLYNCYALTKDKRYLEMAREYDYNAEYYDFFANGTNAFTPQRHAYSHVNSLCSAARIYEATGDEKYFKAISNAWEFLTGTQMYASGGWGPNERFVTAGEGKLAASLSFKGTRWHFHTRAGDYANNFETCCGSYANVNLDRYLLHFTGGAKYGDNMERVLFNGILAALPMQPDGRTFYYSDYHPGAHKQYFPSAWPCCSGTYAEVTADYPLDIYFHDDDGLYVNIFTPSQVRWRRGGKIITVEQTTKFPESDTTTFTIHTKKSANFALNVRVPKWTIKPATVLMNGQPANVAVTPGTFLKISRDWRDGDIVAVTFPMSLRFEPIDAQTPNLAALMYGPIMLVALADGEVNFSENEAHPENWIQMKDKATLTFQAKDGRIFLPFYLIKDERYTTYCRFSSASENLADK
ncbi:MAG: beta-L-arabinofuranosidase domain-containing protein [Limisphaerales bacterium]